MSGQLRLGDVGAVRCDRCLRDLEGLNAWDVVDEATGEVLGVCPLCARGFKRVRQRVPPKLRRGR